MNKTIALYIVLAFMLLIASCNKPQSDDGGAKPEPVVGGDDGGGAENGGAKPEPVVGGDDGGGAEKNGGANPKPVVGGGGGSDTEETETETAVTCPPDTSYTVPERPFDYAGAGLTELTEAQLPKNTVIISKFAFQNNKLTTLSLPPCLTAIGAFAFRYNKLTSVTIPAYVTNIAPCAFSDNQLTELIFAAGVSIGVDTIANQFDNNPLKTVTLSSALYEAFKKKGYIPVTKSNYFPDSVTTFQTHDGTKLNTVTCPPDTPHAVPKRPVDYAGAGLTELTEAQLPKNTVTIGAHSFQNNRLTTLSLPPCLTAIGAFAFRYNKLTSVTIPAYVTSIAPRAFANNQLTELIFAEDIPTTVGNSGITGGGHFESNPLKTVTLSRALYEAFKTKGRIPVTESSYFPNSVTTFQTHDGTKLN